MAFAITVLTHRALEEWGWRCGVCGAPHVRWQRQCASCRTYDVVKRRGTGGDGADAPARSRALRDTARDTAPPVALAPALGWLDALLGGGLPRRCCWLLAGAPGGGKTTLAMQVCAAWPRREAPPLWVSTEQPSGRVAAYAARLGVRDDTVVYGNEADVASVRAVARLALAHRARLVVVDSVQGLAEPGAVLWLNRWAYRHNTSVVLVSQVNSDGEAAGGPRPRHDASMVATLRRGAGDARTLVLDKSQHGAGDGTALELVKTASGALAPA